MLVENHLWFFERVLITKNGWNRYLCERKPSSKFYCYNFESMPTCLKGLWEILWGYLGTYFEVKVFTFMQSLSSYLWPSKTIRPNSTSFQRYRVKRKILWINLWIHGLIHLCLLIFLKWLIFSVDWLSHKIFTSQCFLWCVLSNQGDYSDFRFYKKSLNNP